MLSVTSTLAAAIAALVRRPVAQVLVEWDNDTYADVYFDTYGLAELAASAGSVVVDRAITTDLPAEANIIEGDAAGQATVSLVGDINGVSPAQTLSPYTSHLGGGRRVGVPVTVKFGFVGDAGTEWVPALVGKVRTAGTSDDGTATLTTLDGPELLRTAVTLPVFVAVDSGTSGLTYKAPGLNAQWVIDYALRANGKYVSPPKRASAIMAATLHGSAWPEIGTLTRSVRLDYVTSNFQGAPAFTPLSSGALALTGDEALIRTSSADVRYTPLTGGSVNSGSSLFVEFDALLAGSSGRNFIWLYGGGYGSTTFVQIGCSAGGSLFIVVSRSGVTGNITIGAGLTDTERYVGIHLEFTAAGANVNVRIDGTSSSGTIVVGNSAGNPGIDLVSILPSQYSAPVYDILSSVQLTTEAYSAGMFNNAFVPTAVLQKSLNELTAMPAVEDRMPWPLLQEIVEAEQGVILFDESGIVRFYNRDHMTGGRTAVATLRAVKELKGVSASETIDSVRNIVRVPAAPLKVDTVDSIVWATSETLMVPASGSLIVPAQFDGPAVSLDISFISYTAVSGITATAGSGYRGARNSDGTGGDISNLSITLAQYPARLVMFITNPNAYDVWLVNNSLATAVEPNIAGRPLLQIVGRLARPPQNPYTSRATDSGSVGTYGEQPLDVGENIWRQSVLSAETLSASLLAMLKEPHAVLNGVEVVGDPRLQLADRVTLIDTEGIGWARDVWLLGITSRLESGGFTQTVAVREAGSATTGMTGTFIWDVSTWDSLDGWVA